MARSKARFCHAFKTLLTLFHDFVTWTDPDGIAWAGRRLGHQCFAVTWLGAGWVFDPASQHRRADRLAEARHAMGQASPDRHQQELAAVVRRLQLGVRAERVLWAIHRGVMAAHSSVVRLPAEGLAEVVWGRSPSTWHRNWRQQLWAILEGLTWLHVAPWPEEGYPSLGETTALLTHVGDLRRQPESDVCDDNCPGRDGPRHHHYLVNIGRGFLGVLEEFAGEEAEGIRSYGFPMGGRRPGGPTLRRVGKTGRLTSVYLPAKLGEPAACNALSAGQHRLLQSLVREITRKTKESRRELSEPEVFAGNQVRDFLGKSVCPCPYLSATGNYVTFGGNGKRKGLGYRLTSQGGWLAKAGYPLGEIETFLDDLDGLAELLGLTVLGLQRGTQAWFNLSRMRALAASAVGRAQLHRLHVRVYTAEAFLRRWNNYFGWSEPVPPSATPADNPVIPLLEAMWEKGVSRRALAQGLGQDPSFLGKVLNAKKACPEGLLERAQAWVGAYTPPVPTIMEALPSMGQVRAPSPAIGGSLPELDMLAVARECLHRGWSVVPQRPGAKKPCIKWKPFQDRLPTEEELEGWFREWPDAGLAVVLGPVSGLFALDVDGPEAHVALLEHLDEEPVAPKALSGSRKPYRYHLFFQDPGVATRAKATPWHKKLEFRGQGGIVVIPPSLHPSGQRYAWVEGRSVNELQLPDVPAAILTALQPAPRPTPSPSPAASSLAGLDAS